MAADKTTKTTAKQAEGSYVDQLAGKRADLLEARKSLRGGELVNPRMISQYRKDIARLLTKINADKKKESK